MPKVAGWQGRYFEDFRVDDVYESRVGRTITEADNIWFTLLTNNTNQAHYNITYANRAGMDACIVNSALTLAIVAGLTVSDVSENGINLGWDDIRLTHPVFPGDTLFARSTVLAVRESNSRPEMGIVTVETEGLNQDGVSIMRYTRSIFTWKRDHAPSQDSFPVAAEVPSGPSRLLRSN
jgi:acyl dehydratase